MIDLLHGRLELISKSHGHLHRSVRPRTRKPRSWHRYSEHRSRLLLRLRFGLFYIGLYYSVFSRLTTPSLGLVSAPSAGFSFSPCSTAVLISFGANRTVARDRLTHARGREGAAAHDKGRCGSLHDNSFLVLTCRVLAITIAHKHLQDLLETKPGATGV